MQNIQMPNLRVIGEGVLQSTFPEHQLLPGVSGVRKPLMAGLPFPKNVPLRQQALYDSAVALSSNNRIDYSDSLSRL